MTIARRDFLARAAITASAPLLSWAIPAAAAETMKAEAGPTDPARLNAYPAIDPARAQEIAPGVTIIPDPRINFVPNIGIIEGRDAVLVVDTGIGVENGRRVLEHARRIAAGRPIRLTLTHFHPEHGFGAQVFKGAAEIVYNAAQAEELAEKGPAYLDLFRTFGPNLARALDGVEIVRPDRTYAGATTIDLGGRTVVLREMPAHCRGDQIVLLPDERIVFTGDLVENRFFPIFPDGDAKGARWIEVLKEIEGLGAQHVVPGHGAVGGVEIVAAVRGYLELVQREVGALARDGLDVETVDARLMPALRAHHAIWDNAVWIPFAVRVFYAEATGDPLKLPAL